MSVLFAILMAIEAAGAQFLHRSVLEGKNLAFVSASISVFLARPIKSLATLPLRPFLAIHGGHEVRRSFIVLVEILRRRVLVAALAHLGTNIERGVGGPLVNLGFWRRAGIATALFRCHDRKEETQTCGRHSTHCREVFFEQSQSSPRFRSANEPRCCVFGAYGDHDQRASVKNG